MKEVKIIGVSGISGAGKSTLVKALANKLNASSLFWDDFDEISKSPDDYINWFENSRNYQDFDYPELAHVLKMLKKDKTVEHPTKNTLIIPTEYIIVDAPLGYAHQQTAQYIDTVFYINTPLDIALSRRVIRDSSAKDVTKEEIIKQLQIYLSDARPLFAEEGMCQIENTADFILDGTLVIDQLVDVVISLLKTIDNAFSFNSNIEFVDSLDTTTEKKMHDEFIEHEQSNGIDVNYKKFSLKLSKDNEVVGVLNAYTAFSEVYIDDIWVDKNYRGHGLGRLLIQYLENHFRGKGFNNINLVTSDFQAPEFYKKCGFKTEFRRINEKNAKLSKTFFVKFFGEKEQGQGVAQ